MRLVKGGFTIATAAVVMLACMAVDVQAGHGSWGGSAYDSGGSCGSHGGWGNRRQRRRARHHHHGSCGSTSYNTCGSTAYTSSCGSAGSYGGYVEQPMGCDACGGGCGGGGCAACGGAPMYQQSNYMPADGYMDQNSAMGAPVLDAAPPAPPSQDFNAQSGTQQNRASTQQNQSSFQGQAGAQSESSIQSQSGSASQQAGSPPPPPQPAANQGQDGVNNQNQGAVQNDDSNQAL